MEFFSGTAPKAKAPLALNRRGVEIVSV